MGNGVLYTFLGLEALFVIGGIILLVVAVLTRNAMNGEQTINTVANTLLLSNKGPLTAALANASLVFVAFLLSIPTIVAPTDRLFLKIHAYAVVICALFTLTIGLDIWYQTLNTGANLDILWGQQDRKSQSLLQERFECCGYRDPATPPFVPDSVCVNQLVAANLMGCVGPFSSFANNLLSQVFTADFAIVAIDAMLVLAIACLLKDRKEKARYALIDAKTGSAPI